MGRFYRDLPFSYNSVRVSNSYTHTYTRSQYVNLILTYSPTDTGKSGE